MRKLLSIVFLLVVFPGFSQDYFWFSPGVGASFANQSTMVHLPISATFLRFNRWGFTVGLESNLRSQRQMNDHSLHAYSGFNACFAYNIHPYDDYKMIARAGISKGDVYYLGDQLPSVYQTNGTTVQEVKQFDPIRFNTVGAYLSFELVAPGRKEYRGWSLEFYANLMKRSYAGVCLRLDIGSVF